MKKAQELKPKLIICGGHSEKVKDYITNVDYQESDFVISGLNHLYLSK